MRGKLGVPRPVTGSQPGAVGNPSVPHAGFDPSVMSFHTLANQCEYIYNSVSGGGMED